MENYLSNIISKRLIFFIIMSFITHVNSNEIDYESKPKKVVVGEVKVWGKTEEKQLQCVVESPFIYQVSSQLNAKLIMLLTEGTIIDENEIVAQQDDSYLATEKSQIMLDIEHAKFTAEYEKSEYERTKRLVGKNMISQSDENTYKLNLQLAKLKELRLYDSLKVINKKLEEAIHRSPFKAQVLSVSSKVGERMQVGDNILQLLPLDKQRLSCKFPLSEYESARPLTRATFYFKDIELQLANISQHIDIETQSLTLLFDQKGDFFHRFFIGQRINISMVSVMEGVTKVPHDSVKTIDKTTFIWSVDREGFSTKVPVKVISIEKDYYIIESSLNAGELVALRGFKNLGVKKRVQPIDENGNLL